MSKVKEYNLTTIEDICRLATKENFKSLTNDLVHCIAFHISLKNKLTKKEYKELRIGSIIWKDDGIEGLTSLKVNGEIIQIKPKNEN